MKFGFMALSGVALAFLVSARVSDGWIERDGQGRVRLHGRFDAQGDYVLELMDVEGRPTVSIKSGATGGAAISLRQGNFSIQIEQTSEASLIRLRDDRGAEAALSVEADGSSLILRGATGSGVQAHCKEGESVLQLNSGKGDREARMAMCLRPSSAYLFTEMDGRRGMEIADSPDQSSLFLGVDGVTGGVRLNSFASGHSQLAVVGPKEESGGVVLNHSADKGAGLLVMHEGGKPGVRIGVDAEGRAIANIADSNGKVVDLVEKASVEAGDGKR